MPLMMKEMRGRTPAHEAPAAPQARFGRTARPVSALAAALLSCLSTLLTNCTAEFPDGDFEAGTLSALFLVGNLSITPSAPFQHVAAGATYQFRMSGGSGAATFTTSDCGGSIDSSTGLFTAGHADATCVVTGRDPTGSLRSVSFPVRTYAGLIMNHGTAIHTYLRLEGNATDSSGQSNHGTLNAAPAFATTGGPLDVNVYPTNQHINLNGTTQFINGIPGFNPATEATTNGFSAEIWFKLDTADALVRMSSIPLITQQACASGTNRSWLNVDAGGQDQISTNLGGVILRSGVTVAHNTWYHAAVTIRGNTLRLYVNGRLRRTATVSVEPCTTGSPQGNLNIGVFGADFFQGRLDEAAIYKTELTAEDISRHYLTGLAKTIAFDNLNIYPAYGTAHLVAAFGGMAPFTYASASALSGDSLDTSTGIYTAPTMSAASQVQASKTISGTDTHGNVAQHGLQIVALPSTVPNLTAWYSADQVRDKDDLAVMPADRVVNALLDQSATGILVGGTAGYTRPSAAALPTADRPALDFSVLGPLVSGIGYEPLFRGGLTLFALVHTTGGNGVIVSYDGPIVAGVANDVLFQLGVSGGFLTYAHENNAGTIAIGPPALALNMGAAGWYLVGFRRTAAGTSVRLYMNAAQELHNSLTMGPDTTNGGTSSNLRIGAANQSVIGSPALWGGRIAEVAMYSRALSNTEVEQLQCYFKLKYTLAISLATYCP